MTLRSISLWAIGLAFLATAPLAATSYVMVSDEALVDDSPVAAVVRIVSVDKASAARRGGTPGDRVHRACRGASQGGAPRAARRRCGCRAAWAGTAWLCRSMARRGSAPASGLWCSWSRLAVAPGALPTSSWAPSTRLDGGGKRLAVRDLSRGDRGAEGCRRDRDRPGRGPPARLRQLRRLGGGPRRPALAAGRLPRRGPRREPRPRHRASTGSSRTPTTASTCAGSSSTAAAP